MSSADSDNPAVRVVTLLVNSNMEELAMYAVAVLPLLYSYINRLPFWIKLRLERTFPIT